MVADGAAPHPVYIRLSRVYFKRLIFYGKRAGSRAQNTPAGGTLYIANGIQRMTEDAFTIRADSQITSRDAFTARYLYDDQRQFFPFDILFISASLPAFPFSNPERRQSLALSHTHTLSDRVINEARLGLNRQRNPNFPRLNQPVFVVIAFGLCEKQVRIERMAIVERAVSISASGKGSNDSPLCRFDQ
jgi:hypothetical protein